jgi:2-alkyl-3-oxoalkanoate reductase
VPTALVTGATGLVGSHIVERLTAEHWSVRALVRDPAAADRQRVGWDSAAWLRAHSVELAPGDVLDLPSFVRAAAGCDVVFHTAAAVTPRARGIHAYDAYRIPNVDGTRNAIGAAERAGARLLQLSSVAVYGPKARYAVGGTPRDRVDESLPLTPLPERAFYARSKRESEELVLRAHAEGRIWATAVRPDVIYGARDRQFVPRIARLLRFGIGPVVNGGLTTLAIVHAANVADGAVRAAMTPAAGGRTFNLANDYDVTLASFYRLAGEGLGRRVRIASLPMWFVRGALTGVQAVARVASGGSLSVVSDSSLGFITKNNPFTSERARREVGWSPSVRPETGIPDAFRWWREHHG